MMSAHRPTLTVGAVLVLSVLVVSGCGERVGEDAVSAGSDASRRAPELSADEAAAFAALAIGCAEQEYPNKIAHTMRSDADQGTPGSLHPAFFGCFDWHSSVHGHWLLARFARRDGDHPAAAEARRILDAHLTPGAIAAETAYLQTEGRESWERPYGLAWLLQLAAELHEWAAAGDADAARWAAHLQPLTAACVARLSSWLPKLAYPIRTGEHSQTAFAFGVMLDYARVTADEAFAALVAGTTRRLYLADTGGDLRFEPSGQDFLSPLLAEADLMRRVLPPEAFADWLTAFLPQMPVHPAAPGAKAWLPVARVTDRSDGKLAHLDGLNLSRAWMLEGIVAGLPAADGRRTVLKAAADRHRQAGLAAVTGEHYAGGHWLGTYAVYLVTGRGLGGGS
jgi:hypothetical protein